jgi:hypothetical protein
MLLRSTRPGSRRNLNGMSTRRSARRHRVVATFAASFVLVACASTPPPPQEADPLDDASTRSTLPSNVGPTDCSPPSSAREIDLGLEVELASTGEPIWALFEDPDVRSGREVTVWWRIPGKTALSVVLVGGGGREVVVNGEHPDPTLRWPRTGDQWVSTFSFPEPGCWRISATRGTVHGDAWIRVA